MAKGDPRPLGGFSIAVSFAGKQVLLVVSGELDRRTAVELSAVLDAMLAGDHRDVVLDLADGEFLDAPALGMVLGALSHPGPSDGGFKLCSLSAMADGSLQRRITEGEPAMNADEGPLAGFGVAVSFVGEQVVLAVRGEIDLVIAPEVGAVLDAVIDRGHFVVVLDLADCAFMDASGLGVIATRAARLKRAGGVLVIASPSPLVIRLLDITGLIGVVQVEQSEPALGHLGPEQSRSSADATPNCETAGLVPHLRSVTAVPADTDVVDGALRLVVALAKATVEGADGVSVSLRRHGRLATVAASDQTISDMDADQYATGEGPCVSASVEGRWFHVESLACN